MRHLNLVDHEDFSGTTNLPASVEINGELVAERELHARQIRHYLYSRGRTLIDLLSASELMAVDPEGIALWRRRIENSGIDLRTAVAVETAIAKAFLAARGEQ